MAYKQLVNPNLDPYLYQNGKVVTNWVGYCILYARTAFGTPPAGASATDAYNNTKLRHTDALPSGVYVPVWFTWTGTIGGVRKNWGHVAIYKDGICWTTPLTKKTTADKLTIAQIESKYGAKYIGWSEDIGGVRVVEPLTEGEIVNQADITNMYRVLLGREPDTGGLSVYTGKTWNLVFNSIINSAEYKSRQENINKTISDLQTALANEQAKPAKEVIKEVEKIVVEYKDREVVKEVEVEPKWLSKVRDAVLTFLKIKKG